MGEIERGVTNRNLALGGVLREAGQKTMKRIPDTVKTGQWGSLGHPIPKLKRYIYCWKFRVVPYKIHKKEKAEKELGLKVRARKEVDRGGTERLTPRIWGLESA